MCDFPFKPLSNYIVLELQEPKDRVSNGGVIIPSSVQQKTIATKVVAVSDEIEKDGTPFVRNVKVGDNVIFDIRTGQLIDVEGKDYLVIRETELFGILTGEGGSLLQINNPGAKNKIVKPTFN